MLFTVRRATDWGLALLSFETNDVETLHPLGDGVGARYVPTGHLVYGQAGGLLAVPFDLGTHELSGSPVSLVGGVQSVGIGIPFMAISDAGSLVYAAGPGSATSRTLVWVDRDGTEEALAAEPSFYLYPRLSPDGTRVALDTRDDGDDVWIWDLTRAMLTRLTFAPESDGYPVWTPDGQRVVFSSRRDGSEPNLYWRAADGTGAVERLTESPNPQYPNTISLDGTHLVFREDAPDTGSDLYVLTLDDDRQIEPLLVTEFDERNADISPDGRWLAYEWDASGRGEIFVQPFPDVDARRWRISTTGGTQPLWGPEGRELFYLTEAGVMGVTVETGASLKASPPALVVEVLDLGIQLIFPDRIYDIAPDGQRFLMLKAVNLVDTDDPFAGLKKIHVVQNWFEELKARVPSEP